MKIGQIQQSKGGSFYGKIGSGLPEGTTVEVSVTVTNAAGETFTRVLKNDDPFFLQTPQEQIEYLVSSGKLTAAEAEARKAKVPDFIRYNINLPSEKVGS